MIHIVGGTYLETCKSPVWNQLYGSGGRSAAALGELSESVVLHTYLTTKDLSNFRLIAASFKFQLQSYNTNQLIAFHYFHGLSKPQISPEIHQIRQLQPIHVKAETILRFGFMEGDAVVNGNKVVYDPQSAHNPKPFNENGSEAEQLAIVMNLTEGYLLTGKKNPLEICKNVQINQKAYAVILKMGSLGALVWHKDDAAIIPCIETHTVWPIGSGDIFAAVFAHCWAERNKNIFESAFFASQATADYCATSTLPIDNNIFQKVLFNPDDILKPFDKCCFQKKTIYLAGPFFTISQRWLIEELRKALIGQGLDVFSPLHDVGRGAATDVVGPDLAGLKTSNVVLAVLDGLDPGTIFEVGFARALNLPTICFVQNEKDEDLKMFVGTDCEIVNDFSTAIYRTIWKASK